MANTRILQKRRKAIRNIRKITRTMELIATAQFKKSLERALQAEAYTQRIAELAADLSANAGDLTHPLLQAHTDVKHSVLLVLGSNRGLCGGYNGSILREAVIRMRLVREEGATLHAELCGKRPIAFFKFQRIAADQTYTHLVDKPQFEQIEEIANRYIASYTAGEIDRVDVAYMKFINAARQMPVVETLLPLSTAPSATKAAVNTGPKVEYEFMPDAGGILRDVLPESFKVRLFKCFLDASVSESIARRVAMKAATDNADEIIRNLSQEYNRARQSKITTEISEIIGGAAALE